MKNQLIVFCCFLFFTGSLFAQKKIELASPDRQTKVTVFVGQQIEYTVNFAGMTILGKSKIAMQLNDGTIWGKDCVLKSQKEVEKSERIEAPFYKIKSFNVRYKELNLKFKGDYGIYFRAYDDGGVAYRFYTIKKGNIDIVNEVAEFNFADDYMTYTSHTTGKKDPFAMAFQNIYQVNKISEVDSTLAFLPVTIDEANGIKVTLLEADLEDYPGMFIIPDKNKTGFKGVFAHYPSEVDYYPWRTQQYVTKRNDKIAQTQGKRSFPWRIIAITENDTKMPENNLVYALASPNRIGDYSWIKPGKSAWEWWNNWGVWNVDFVSGINMDTYKYYIDFAAEYGLQYVILDEGWYDGKKGNMMEVIPELDLSKLVEYAQRKNVDLILWTVFNVLDKQLDEACKYYSELGIKGFKVDFLDRDDQEAVKMTYRIAEGAAKYHLMLDFHGFYKPTGLNRTFPNIINFESVFGMEEMKWSTPDVNMVQYDVTFPFIRLMCGPVDYTPGAMRNATKHDFQPIYSNPLSQGTRCHQLATYIVFDSPFTMLCDSPVLYENEPAYTKFLASLPVVFDTINVVSGELGKYIVTTRKKDNTWYVGGLTNWDERDLNIDFSFLDKGKTYKVTLYTDGINANKQASDYKVNEFNVTRESIQSVHLASGGGFVMKVSFVQDK